MAMAASLTDHVWTTTALLSCRVPPHFLDKDPGQHRLPWSGSGGMRKHMGVLVRTLNP